MARAKRWEHGGPPIVLAHGQRYRKIYVLRFLVFNDSQPASAVDLSGAYVFGSDAVPIRADLDFKNGGLTCNMRVTGPAGLAVLWPVDGVGKILLETTRLQERKAPYVLSLELARGQLMRFHHKSEEWGMFDCPDVADLNAEIKRASKMLVAGLQSDDPAEASRLGNEALALTVRVAEELTRMHAAILLQHRRETAGFSRLVFGCRAGPENRTEDRGRALLDAFDFASVPVRWKQIEPAEQTYDWQALDAWIEWLSGKGLPIKGTGLVSFQEQDIPDWLYIWEHDFETVREFVVGHVRRVVERYAGYIQVWDAISGIHANQAFSFNFEQLMELTGAVVAETKRLAPRGTTLVELVAPWGEYYARNQRTIPPSLYAEMVLQSGINFDALGLQFCFGVGTDGMFVRDMFQISSIIDKFGNFGKPLHITAVQVPSSPVARGPEDADAGAWHEPWNEAVQSRWLRCFYEIALSKPFVETVTWRELSDDGDHLIPCGGLLNADSTRKPAYDELLAMRKEFAPDAAPE